MKSIILLALLFLAAWPARADDDELMAVDTKSNMITVEQKGRLKTYRLGAFTDVVINGLKSSVDQLRPGMEVTLVLSGQTASKVSARGNAAPPAVPPPIGGVPVAKPGVTPGTPPPAVTGTPIPAKPIINTLSPSQVTRKIVLKATIDGDDKVFIQDGKLRIEHGGWQKLSNISINGIKWKPEWNGNSTDDFVGFVPPLAPFGNAVLSLRKVQGRGNVTIAEPPTDTNGQKLVLHFQDEGGGSSEFEIRLSW